MMQQITGYTVSNKAYTNQMLGQQLLLILGKHLGLPLQGYYKYHSITIFSSDPHLNHQIYTQQPKLIDMLALSAKNKFGVDVKIKQIRTFARSTYNDNEHYTDAHDNQ